MKNRQKIANAGTYDNTAAIKSFKDTTTSALAKYPYDKTIMQVNSLYTALTASGKSEAEQAKIKLDINVLHDLVVLYLDTGSPPPFPIRRPIQ